jgi:hypothetical protein
VGGKILATARLAVGLALAFGTAASASDTISYTYDPLGQLVAVSVTGGPDNGQTVAVSYDKAGNRTNYTAGDGTSGSTAQISIGNASVTEGGTLSFTVTRSVVTTTAVSAHYATAGGSATQGGDFTAASGTVSFAANETSKIVNVVTTDDSTTESAETMTVTLSNPSSGAIIATAVGTGTINDNDGNIVISTSGYPSSMSILSQYGSLYGCTSGSPYPGINYLTCFSRSGSGQIYTWQTGATPVISPGYSITANGELQADQAHFGT